MGWRKNKSGGKKKIMEKRDCFAYLKDKERCRILTELVCAERDCSFYKTKDQFNEGRKDAEKRMINLCGIVQAHELKRKNGYMQ